MNKQFFYLLRAAIGTGPFFERPRTSDEWRAMYRLSVVQGVTAVVFDFIKTLPVEIADLSEDVLSKIFDGIITGGEGNLFWHLHRLMTRCAVFCKRKISAVWTLI